MDKQPACYPLLAGVIETKSRQTLVFDPGGSAGRLRACPCIGTWSSLLYGELFVRALDVAEAFFAERGPRNIIFRSEVQATRTCCGRSLFSP